MRLVGGPSSHEGRLEVNYNGVWGTVCDDGFTHTAATVACRSLNFTYVFYLLLGTFLCLFLCGNCSVVFVWMLIPLFNDVNNLSHMSQDQVKDKKAKSM